MVPASNKRRIQMQNINFNALASQFGTFNKDDLKIGSAEYVRKTASDMLADVVEALQDAKAELETFDGFNLPIKKAQFKARMITRIRGGFVLTVGYGTRNERLVKPVNFIVSSKADQRQNAIAFIDALVTEAQNGMFNDALNEKLASYRDRAEKGNAARKAEQNAQLAMAAE